MLIGFDFETKSELSLPEVGAYKYASHPSTDVLMCWFLTDTGEEIYWSPVDGKVEPVHAPHNGRLLAHNRLFEFNIWNHVLVPKYGFDPLPINKTMDTQDQTLMCGFGRGLAVACDAAKVHIKKDPRGKELIKMFCMPPFACPFDNPEEWEQFKAYGKTDVLAMMVLHRKLPKITPHQQDVSDLTMEINQRGLLIDREAVDSAVQMVEDLQLIGSNRLIEITEGKITRGTQRARIKDWLESAEGLELPNMQADTIKHLDPSELTQGAQEMLGIYQICGKSSIAKFTAMKHFRCDDGRVHQVLTYHGAQPGRWTGSGVQFQNLPRPVLPKAADYEKIINLIRTGNLWRLEKYGKELAENSDWKYNPMEILVSSIRAMIIAPEGKEFYSADYSAIEARGAVWLAGDEEGLQIYYDGGDPYKEIAAQTLGISVPEVTDLQRFMGKQTILSCQYQVGWKKLKDQLWQIYGIKITAKETKQMVNGYRKKYSKVKQCWDDFQNAALSAIKSKTPKKFHVNDKVYFYRASQFLVCVLPSGRKLYYAYPRHRQILKVWDGDKEEWRMPHVGEENKSVLIDEIQYLKYKEGAMKWVHTYGGSFFQSAVQAIAADCMGKGLLSINEAGFHPNLSVHDEGLAEVEKDLPVEEMEKFKSLLCEMDGWANGLPLQVEEWIGPRYRK